MRRIGSHKGSEINVESVFLRKTYEGYLVGNHQVINQEIIGGEIRGSVRKYFGEVPWYLVGDDIDPCKLLPVETVLAKLVSWKPIGEGDGAHLVLVWFQEYGKDPFTMAAEKFKTIDWEKEAEDFEV